MRVQQLFAEVVGLDEERRSARLERIEDSGIRREVQTLLDRHACGEPLSENALSPSRPEAEEHEVVGRYRLLDELGRGAMGVVYRAEDIRLGRPVALKFLSPELSADQRARARLEREARAASALDHPNICTVYEIGETDDGRLFLALACYDGETLQRRIERGRLEVEEAVRTAVHVARGLAAAHRHGIVHRDVKPSNVLITDERAVKLLDFGIARVADSELTGSGDVLGTVAYMSPEQLRGEVDARVDVWGLGVVLYEMLAGHRPFRGDYEAALLYAVLHEDPAPLDRDDVPEELAEIVRRCLEKDSDARYQSAEEVEVALERLGLREASQPMRRRVARRRRGLMVGLGAVVLALAMLASPLRTQIAEGLGFGRPDLQHLAVLPLMAPASEASMGEGLTLTLTSLLTRLGADAEEPIRVVAASEMREIETAAEARERYGVGVVVSGDFQQDGDEVRLTLNLIDARTLRQIDSETLTERADRLPALQQQATTTLARMLGVMYSDERWDRIEVGGTVSAEAYRFYLKGEAALERYDQPENVDKALELFSWALDADSLYALAHAGLAEAAMRKYEYLRDGSWVRRAEMHGQRALELADRLAPVRVTLGKLHALTGDYEAAASQFGLALELEGAEADAHHGLGNAYANLGRAGLAERHLRRAIELQPSNWEYHHGLGVLLLDQGSYQEARKQFEQIISLEPDNVSGYINLGVTYYYLDEAERAVEILEEGILVQPTWDLYSNLGFMHFMREDHAREVQTYERAIAADSIDYRIWGNLAGAYERNGDDDLVARTRQRAARMAEQHLTINPNDAVALIALAEYRVGLEQPDQAKTALSRAVTLDGLSVEDMASIGTLFERLGGRQQAHEWIKRALEGGYPRDHLDKTHLEELLRDSLITTLNMSNSPIGGCYA